MSLRSICGDGLLGLHHVLVVITWKSPLPGFNLALDRIWFASHCAMPADGVQSVGRSPVRARASGLRYLLQERRKPPLRFQEFEDDRVCDEWATIEVQVETRLDARGLLTFEAVAQGDRCWPARTVLKPKPVPLQVVTPQPDIPCCGDAAKGPGEE